MKKFFAAFSFHSFLFFCSMCASHPSPPSALLWKLYFSIYFWWKWKKENSSSVENSFDYCPIFVFPSMAARKKRMKEKSIWLFMLFFVINDIFVLPKNTKERFSSPFHFSWRKTFWLFFFYRRIHFGGRVSVGEMALRTLTWTRWKFFLRCTKH